MCTLDDFHQALTVPLAQLELGGNHCYYGTSVNQYSAIQALYMIKLLWARVAFSL